MNDADDAYANAPYIPGGADYPARWTEAAASFRARVPGEVYSYGPSPRQHYELYEAPQARGTLIFVHGGYWRMTDQSVWSHLADGVLARGWSCALPGYDLCPQVRIAGITQQIAQAIPAIAGRVDGPLILAGHSAGGQLVARMCAPGMLPADVMARVKAVVPISPLADLEPLLATSMNADFALDAGLARAESPVHQPAPDVPVRIWVGEEERPAFLDQARWLGSAWGCPVDIRAGHHHYSIIDDLPDVLPTA
ncbi:MAG: alpha/beta hydrolase [Pseudomonadota bacterium]